MKTTAFLYALLIPIFATAQIKSQTNHNINQLPFQQEQQFTKTVTQLTLKAAVAITENARIAATGLQKNVTIAILDHSGQILMITRGEEVGPHNTEAARRKAYTALSTKTPTLILSRNSRTNPDTQNLTTLPELLLLAGGYPLWHNGQVIGSIGIAGGGSPENDDFIAKSGALPSAQITTY
ncbi:GlcG/HbpS family heme-binding protein [Flavobacterium tiangeerense]|uniref:GlcG/HbpS family heme-binding protein n=1 Tax=Flavobacterium tiangeerense TaxID=459471 RepID=UPI0011AB06C9|nr:heme-binding protein [Flavobacterium tiangeerense]